MSAELLCIVPDHRHHSFIKANPSNLSWDWMEGLMNGRMCMVGLTRHERVRAGCAHVCMYVRGMYVCRQVCMYVCMHVGKSALKPESATTREQIIESSVQARTVLILATVP